MENPRIMIDMTKLADLYCGLGQVSFHFARHLKFYQNRADFHFLVKEKQENVWGYEVKTHKTNLLKRHFSALNTGFDIWHAIHQDSAFIPAEGKTKYILTIHDLNFLHEKSPQKAEKRLKRLQKKVDRADALCFISNYARKVAEQHLEINHQLTRVIYNGVPVLDEEQTKPQIAPRRKFLFNLGVLMPKKNHEAIIRMMKHLPEYDLLIGGGGNAEYRKGLEDLVAELGLKSQICFSGYLNEAEKSWAYHHAEAFVFPSLNEGFGLPIVEAMSAGLPVFCSNKTSLPEIGGDQAVYWKDFNPETMANVLREGLSEFSSNSEASEKLKHYANRFSWEKHVDAYITLYSDLC